MLGNIVLEVEGAPAEVAQSLWGDAKPYAELKTTGRTVLVNPVAVIFVDEPGTPHVHVQGSSA